MTRHILQTNGKKQSCRQVWLMLVMILVLVVTGPPRILAAKENMPLAAGMAVNKAQSLMAVEKPDQALAWAEKGLAKKDDPELMNIREYVLATRKVPY